MHTSSDCICAGAGRGWNQREGHAPVCSHYPLLSRKHCGRKTSVSSLNISLRLDTSRDKAHPVANGVQQPASKEATERNGRTRQWCDKRTVPAAQNTTSHIMGARIWIQRKESDISNIAQLVDNHMSPRMNFSSPTLSISLLKCRSLLPTFLLVPHQPGW